MRSRPSSAAARLAAGAGAAVLVWAAAGSALAQAGEQGFACARPEATVPAEYFGLHMHRFHDRRLLAREGYRSWRLWDSGTSWRDLQPERGRHDTRRLDLALTLARRVDVKTGLVLGLTPQWAAARPQLRSFMGPGASSEPHALEDWDDYVRWVAERYAGRFEFYEVWNEPNSGGYFGGSPAQMADMARRARRILKDADPQVLVLSPSVSSRAGLPWLRRYAEAGGLRHADVLSYHFYTDPDRPEELIALYRDVEAIVREHRPGLPIWNTESGSQIRADLPAARKPVPPEAHLVRSMALGWCLGIGRFYYYDYDSDGRGLVSPTTFEPTPVMRGWQAAGRWLRGATLSRCERDPDSGRWSCSLRLPGERSVARLAWAEQGQVPIPAGTWQVEDVDGARHRATRGERVGPLPVLLRPAGEAAGDASPWPAASAVSEGPDAPGEPAAALDAGG